MTKEMSGLKFGKWTVIKRSKKPEKSKSKTIYWECECECGKIKSIDGSSLRVGKSLSCGECSRGIDLTGKIFGRLTVVNREKDIKNKKYSFWYWNCTCSCGKKDIIVISRSLINGNTTSCGCYWREKISKGYGESAFNKIFSTYKRIARNRNLEFKLSIQFFKDIIQKNCYYCNTSPSNNSSTDYHNGDFAYNGIDRIDNFLGYVEENVVPCCKICNVAKNNMDLKSFILWIENIYDYFIKEKNEYK